MLHSPDDVAAPRVAARTGPTDHARGHRDHRARHLLAVQPDPGHARGPSRDRRERHPRDLRGRAGRRPAPVHPAPPGGCRGRRLRARRRLPARAASRRSIGSGGSVRSPGSTSPADQRAADQVAVAVARAATHLAGAGFGALIVIERETGLEEIAETGVMVHGDLSADLLEAIFTPRGALHDGAVIIRGASDPRRRRGAPALRDHARRGALRDAAPGGARDHGADGRPGRRRLGGDRPGEHRRAGADPAATSTSLSSCARSSRRCCPERAAGLAMLGRIPSRPGGGSITLGSGALRRAALGDRGRAVRQGTSPRPSSASRATTPTRRPRGRAAERRAPRRQLRLPQLAAQARGDPSRHAPLRGPDRLGQRRDVLRARFPSRC